MARQTVEKELSDLAALAKRRDDPEASRKLSAALGSRVCFVAARAAELAREFNLNSLAADLIGAFDRFLNNPKVEDKGCAAKTAIARALYELGEPTAQPVFLAGIKHVQMEPSFGGPVDVAAELRGLCGLGLVRLGYRQVMVHLVDLLSDPSSQTRSFAARALAYSDRDEAALLLRMKLLSGDDEIDVINECFSALSRIRQPGLIEFLSRFVSHSEPDIRTSAALALGETRQADALEVLEAQHLRERDPDVRRAIVLAAATLRLPAAIEWVAQLIETAPLADAAQAIEALGMFRRDSSIADRVHTAARKRPDSPIAKALAEHFPTP